MASCHFRRRYCYLYLLAAILLSLVCYSYLNSNVNIHHSGHAKIQNSNRKLKARFPPKLLLTFSQEELKKLNRTLYKNKTTSSRKDGKFIQPKREFTEDLVFLDEQENVKDGLTMAINGILDKHELFWDMEVEEALATRASKLANRCSEFNQKVQSTPIIDLMPSTWEKCGREANAYGQLANNAGSFCIRYRDPHNHFVAGEYLSFHLASLLGFKTVPCVKLGTTGDEDDSVRWPVDLSSLKWKENKPIAFIEWVPNLRGGLQIPNIFLTALNSKMAIRYNVIQNASLDDRLMWSQWSDLIIFDYLNGHHDRFARLQDDSDKEHRLDILQSSIPNLGIDKNGLLWFYDNEPGLMDAYSLMYTSISQQSAPTSESVRFRRYHDQMLNTTCLFRRETIRNVLRIYEMSKTDFLAPFRDVVEENSRYFMGEDGESSWLEKGTKWRKLLEKYFRGRLRNVLEHVKKCHRKE